MNRIFKFWFWQVSRGYTLPMSITNWLVAFILGYINNGNLLFGFLALIGFMFAHMGTNVFDDFVDHKLKIPKQEYKSVHLTTGETDLKSILILSCAYFAIAAVIGIFLLIKCGYIVGILAFIGGIIALLYPFANNYALGELAVGLCFGPLLFAGVYYVMTGSITFQAIWISIPITIFTVVVLLVHALMDYDFDKQSGKKTLCIRLGSKQNALNAIFSLIILSFAITVCLIGYGYLPITAGAAFGEFLLPFVLYKRMFNYINTTEHEKNDFLVNFALARNIGTIYCIVVAISLLT